MKIKHILPFLAIAMIGCKNDNQNKDINNEAIAEEALLRKADSLAHAFIITDGHVDLPYRLKSEGIDLITLENGSTVIDAGIGDFDLERAKKGGLDAPFMSIYIPAELQETGGAKALADSLIDLVQSITTTYPEHFALANSPADVEKNFKAGKISLPMGMENGAPIEGDLKNVEYFFNRGIRYITLSHGKDNEITDASYDTTATHGGLSDFGRKVVEEINRVGIMVDVSHISNNAFHDVMEVTKVPVIASHSSAEKFTPGFERNMNDELIKALGENGGVIQINFGSDFLDIDSQESGNRINEKLKNELEKQGLTENDSAAQPYIEQFRKENPYKFSNVAKVADHIDHVVQLIGIDHVGLGSDYDGVGDSLPEGLKDVSHFPNLIAELLRRGYSNEDIEKICYQNVFRVWNAVLDFAQASTSK
ncbi:membrane dipeptidase [Antarcticibacterium arcticum]|uniref:Membrane dipeptidase n=1 Tax=Antarcticibacterium arcticum TaxID=2585771 RepID=A0A5B8YM28_9FLAO|nr:dipeptidase [Antarcticibacterium arcticum]QED38784.1 membrane dipeptidase [Antarcticibacterium arcticum]